MNKTISTAAIVLTLALISALPAGAATIDSGKVDVGPLPPAKPPASMSVSALPTGTYETRAFFAFSGGAWGDLRQFAATALLVRHPKGNLLIDSGFGKNVDAQLKLIPFYQRTSYSKGIPVLTQLNAGGMQASDLAGVFPTHAHWDHISGVDDLVGVPLMVNVEGKRWIDAKSDGTEVLNSFHGVNFSLYDFEGGPYLGFMRSHDVWGDGSVVIVPAPGHTPDSVIVFINLPSGTRYALVGDLVFQSEGIDIPADKPWLMRRAIGENDEEVRKDIALIRSASKTYPQIHAIPAHDLSAFRAIPVFPAFAR